MCRRRRQVSKRLPRINEGHVVGDCHLAGNAADTQGISTIWRDSDVENLFTDTGHLTGICAQRPGCKHHDAAVFVTEAQLALRADHPVGDMAVRRPRGNGEVTGEDSTGECDHDEVPRGEVARSADDVADSPARGTDVHPAQSDGLFEVGEFLDGLNASDHHGTAHATAHEGDRLDLEAHRGEAISHLSPRHPDRQIHHLAKPRHRDAHQTSIPNAEVKRISPSTMSRISVTPWRNISVRSTPMPKAKPE